ncbi:hypothetical protein P8452_70277 [Trifolium repens]|nr:hypothetical protein P8452_70277 [Trifolium repens]
MSGGSRGDGIDLSRSKSGGSGGGGVAVEYPTIIPGSNSNGPVTGGAEISSSGDGCGSPSSIIVDLFSSSFTAFSNSACKSALGGSRGSSTATAWIIWISLATT